MQILFPFVFLKPVSCVTQIYIYNFGIILSSGSPFPNVFWKKFLFLLLRSEVDEVYVLPLKPWGAGGVFFPNKILIFDTVFQKVVYLKNGKR